MNPDLSWLPGLLELQDFGGDWDRYFAAVHRAFEQDFGVPRPDFRGKRMGLKRHPLIEGMSATFWHFVSEGKGETERLPDLRRCERVRWPGALLRNEGDPSRVLTWEEADPRRRSSKVLLTLTDFSYLVVIDDRGDYLLPWTAYPVEREHSRRKLARRREQALRQKC